MVVKDGSKMSKSRGNVIDPDGIINKYGADVMRLFMLFAAPPEPDLEWNNEGIEGASRFLNRVWRLTKQSIVDSRSSIVNKEDETKIKRKLHQTIKKVTEDIERFHFNTAIASIMELVNAVSSVQCQVSSKSTKEILNNIAMLLAPFAPHFSEEA
jgi:leucyl-tRNA synthetase